MDDRTTILIGRAYFFESEEFMHGKSHILGYKQQFLN